MTDAPKTTDRQNKALDLLQTKVAELLDSDGWRDALRLRAKFHKYSLNNLLLIWAQNPDATRVAGFKKWKELGRSVKKGEKGLAILAPMTRRIRDDDTPELLKTIIVGFRTAYVFDVSQTDGEPIPEPGRPELVADDSVEARDLVDRLTAYSESKGFAVAFTSDGLGSAIGSYTPSEKLVRIRPDVTAGQQAKTLAHEVAHALADHKAGIAEADYDIQELEAETAAFLVTDAFGLDTTDYSFRYLAGYTGSAEALDRLLKAGTTAMRLAETIIADLRDTATTVAATEEQVAA